MSAPATTRLVDIVFPGDTNHHGTLLGGVGQSQMDKVAFITAARHAPVDFVTASCERIDFETPATLGDIIELTGRVARVGRTSLSVEVDLVAEALLSGERRRVGRGTFHMVGVGERLAGLGGRLPPMREVRPDAEDASAMVEMVFPDLTSHYGSLHGGEALAAMGKAAFVTATRHCRKPVVLRAGERVDFTSEVRAGEVLELRPRITATGRSSMTVDVELQAETLLSGKRRACGTGRFVMVAVDESHRPVPAGRRAA